MDEPKTSLSYVKSRIRSHVSRPYFKRRLCRSCAVMDFDLSRGASHSYITLKAPSDWESKACDLCSFLDRCSRTPTVPTFTLHEHIRMHSSRYFGGLGVIQEALPRSKKRYSLCKSFSGPDMILLQSPVDLLHEANVTPPSIDWHLVKAWLRTDPGETRWDDPSAHSHEMVEEEHMSLTVIDCETRALVRISFALAYVTLSYVWGPTPAVTNPDHAHGSVPSALPLTIEDSIRVCLELGQNYLWVDRYCIPQTDSKERHRQLQKMDKIYAKSCLTIVACSGGDPNYGLPGVSIPRKQCPTVMLNNTRYLQMIPHPKHIHQSTWASRAWTYQETLLSYRKLYFTDYQLYFEGFGSVECEWSTLSGNQLQTAGKTSWIFSHHTWLSAPAAIYSCIKDFSRRALSYPSDTLNAMMGIFAAYERRFSVRHIWGMPFLDLPRSSDDLQLNFQHPSLSYSLFFITQCHSIRREEFPSWSWAGWISAIFWMDANASMNLLAEQCVSPELSSGSIVSWSEYQINYKTYQQHGDQPSKFIHVQANMVTIFGCSERRYEDGSQRLHLANDQSLLISIAIYDPSFENMLRPGTKTSLIWFPNEHPDECLDYLVVQNVGTHWERIWCIGYFDVEYPKIRLNGDLLTIRLG